MSDSMGNDGTAEEDATGENAGGDGTRPPGTIPAKTGLLIIGGVLLIAVIALIASRGGDDGDPLGDALTGDDAPDVDVDPGPEATAEPDDVDDGFSSGIPPIDCNLMLGSLRALDALESEVIGSSFGGPSFRNGEVCTTTVDGWDDYYVSLSPAPIDDFTLDAQVRGVGGRFVPGVGDAAVWFGGPDAEGGGAVGVLSVARQIPQGGLYFRIELSRPDLDDEGRMAIASDLALHVLRRFPGAAPAPEEPVVLTPAEQPPVDRSTWSYRSYVEAGVDAGETTWAQGVITTLEYLLGDTDSLPGAPDGVTERSVTGFLEWVETGLEVAQGRERALIEDLLERFFPPELAYLDQELSDFPDPDEPLPQADPGGETSDDEGAVVFDTGDTPSSLQFARSGSAVNAQPPVVPNCGDAPVWHNAACVRVYDLAESSDLKEGKYVLLAPYLDQLPALGVTKALLDSVYGVLTEAALTYELLGDMPPVRAAITPFVGETEVTGSFSAGVCRITVWAQNPDTPPAATEQWIAFEMARCLASKDFPQTGFSDVNNVHWFAPALFYYLSDVVVPEGGLENSFVGNLRAEELPTSVSGREHSNTIFFTSIHRAFDPPGVVGIVRNTPRTAGGAAIDSYLGGVTGMAEAFHTFGTQASDNELSDSAGNAFGGGPFASEQVLLEGPAAYNANLEPMRISRLDLVVAPGMYACVDTMEATGDALWSWRPGTTNDSGPWTQSAPEVLEGQSLLLATSTGSGELQVTVGDVVDDPGDCDDDAEEVEPFEFDMDCPAMCGDTEYVKQWFADVIGQLIDAVASEG